ncbi:PHA/PHB synthase family protein [Arenibacterium sp. CAU 1754]
MTETGSNPTSERHRSLAPHDPDRDTMDMIDTAFRAWLSTFTGGLSPGALGEMAFDWGIHLATSPGKQIQLAQLATENALEFSRYIARCALGKGEQDCVTPEAHDRRFSHEGWDRQPFNAYKQAFLLTEKWWDAATTGVRGVSRAHERAANFTARQLLDSVSPANFPLTNPEVLAKTVSTNGRNLIDGMKFAADDLSQIMLGEKPPLPEDFKVGETLAITPGKVVYRNHLMELIQYAPSTEQVRAEPILIVPAWIMKYYILDLTSQNSLVKFLTDQGFTVFMISWRNPGAEDADMGLVDYLENGPMAALDEVIERTGADQVHAVGYCLGGTLLSIAAAVMGRDGDDRLASMTLLAAQMDFTEAGELTLFISESQVAFLEDMMWKNGYLDASQMVGAFRILRSNDLIWSRIQHKYLMGEPPSHHDISAWNADSTRMPYRMHSEYLRDLFLDNKFAADRYILGGHPASPDDIRLPIFAVGTETDHVAPWKSVFKTGALTRSDVTFVLTNGGHNAGIVSEPGHPRRHYRVRVNLDSDRDLSADDWKDLAQEHEGSWWPEWTVWLAGLSTGDPVDPPRMGEGLCDAPGTYVLMR